jgi:hypothetical protein
MKQMQETNSMVEEFMLLANTSVARRINEAFPACALLRSVGGAGTQIDVGSATTDVFGSPGATQRRT